MRFISVQAWPSGELNFDELSELEEERSQGPAPAHSDVSEKLRVPVVGLRCGGAPEWPSGAHWAQQGQEAPEEWILRKLKVVVSLILLSLLAFKELVYPFSWQQQGLTTELNVF